jgi:hypothetical protein
LVGTSDSVERMPCTFHVGSRDVRDRSTYTGRFNNRRRVVTPLKLSTAPTAHSHTYG